MASTFGVAAVLLTQLTPSPAAGLSAPVVSTGAASHVHTGSAQLQGTVDPKGQPTTYHFQYGKGSSFAHSTALAVAGSGTGPVDVSAVVRHLDSGTTYSYRLVAKNALGTTKGRARLFTTLDPRLAGRFKMRVEVRRGGSVFHQHRGDVLRRVYRLKTSCSGPRCRSLHVYRQAQRGHFSATLDRKGSGVYGGTEKFNDGRCDNGLAFKSRVRIRLRVIRIEGDSARRVKGALGPRVSGCVSGSEHASLVGRHR